MSKEATFEQYLAATTLEDRCDIVEAVFAENKRLKLLMNTTKAMELQELQKNPRRWFTEEEFRELQDLLTLLLRK